LPGKFVRNYAVMKYLLEKFQGIAMSVGCHPILHQPLCVHI